MPDVNLVKCNRPAQNSTSQFRGKIPFDSEEHNDFVTNLAREKFIFGDTLRDCGSPIIKTFATTTATLTQGFRERIENYIDNLIKLTWPVSKPYGKSQNKRFTLSFIGTFYKNVFGVALSEDVEGIHNLIHKTANLTAALTDTLHHQSEALFSMVKLTNNRLDNVIEQFHKRKERLAEIYMHLNDSVNSILKFNLLQFRLSYLFHTMEADMSNYLLGMEKLITHGVLSTKIVPMEVLAPLLGEVQKNLHKTNPHFHLAYEKRFRIIEYHVQQSPERRRIFIYI